MKDLAQLELLIEKQKYQKALTLAAKKKFANVSNYRVLELIGMAHYGLKHYGLAATKIEEAAKLAPTDKLKGELYKNVAICFAKMGEKYYNQALASFEKSLNTYSGFENIETRAMATEFALSIKEYESVLLFAPKLVAYSNYAALGLVSLAKAYLARAEQVNFEKQMLIIEGQSSSFSEKEAKNLLVMLKESNCHNWLSKMLNLFRHKFSHKEWFLYFQGDNAGLQLESDAPEEFIVSDDPEVKKLIQGLVDEIRVYGGQISSKLRIAANKGNLSIKAYNLQPEVLIDIPLECMPLLDDFELKVERDLLVAEPKSELTNPSAVKTMSLMTALYNKACKVTQWKEECPFFSLSQDTGLLTKLCDGKKFNGKVNIHRQLALEGKWDELFITSFFGSRKFAYESRLYKRKEEGHISGLLSIIDFFNHRCGASPYKLSNKGISVSGVPSNAEAEVFVNYNQFDPLLTYLIYGFVDRDSDYLFSVPCRFTIGDLVFEILGNTATFNIKNLSHNGSHLSEFLPNIAIHGNSVGIDKLLITPKHPELLREAIQTVLLSVMDKDKINDAILADLVKSFERQLLTQNISYWREVEALAAESALDNGAIDSVHLLCRESKSMIQKYASRHSITLF